MDNYFNVLDYGVKQDCQELQTQAFQTAINACLKQGGGALIVPEGKYYVGSLRLYSHMTLLLEENARLYGSNNYQDYHDFKVPSTLGYLQNEDYIKMWNLPEYYIYGIICAFQAQDIKIIGKCGSVINGQDCYDENGEEKFRGPMGIIFSQCEDITLQGYTFVNSANWSHQLDSCQNIIINNVKIKAGHDGFNLHHCSDIQISDCHLETGDDCVAGYDIRNLLVRDCYFNTACNVLRIGGNKLIFDHCKFVGPGHYPHRSTNSYNTHAVFKYYAICCDKIREDGNDIIIKNSEFEDVTKLLVYDHGNEKMMQNNLPLRKIVFENVKLVNLKQSSLFKGNGERCQLVIKDAFIDYCNQDDFLVIDASIELIMDNVIFNKTTMLKINKNSLVKITNCKNLKLIEETQND